MLVVYLLLIGLFLEVKAYSNYFQVLDELSFNLRTNTSDNIIYNHYQRDGNVLFSHQSLLMTPQINNSHSFFYSSRQINSSNAEIHFSFNVTPHINYSAAFSFWMFTSPLDFLENEKRNTSFNGFDHDFRGFGVMFIASPQSDLDDYKWTVYFKHNNGTNIPRDLGLKTITRYNSCIREIKEIMIVRVLIKKTTISLFFKDYSGNNSPCVVNLARVIQRPYRIGFSTYNGEMDGSNFLSLIQIQKVSVINSDIDSKGLSLMPYQINEPKNIQTTKRIKDFIEGFQVKHRVENSMFYSLDLDIVYYFYMKVFEEFVKEFDRGHGFNCSVNFEKFDSFSSLFPKKINEKITNLLKESICIITNLRAKKIGQLRGADDNIDNNEESDKVLNLKITLSKFSSNKVLSKLNDYIQTMI